MMTSILAAASAPSAIIAGSAFSTSNRATTALHLVLTRAGTRSRQRHRQHQTRTVFYSSATTTTTTLTAAAVPAATKTERLQYTGNNLVKTQARSTVSSRSLSTATGPAPVPTSSATTSTTTATTDAQSPSTALDHQQQHDADYRWPSIYHEVREMMMAAYVSYPLSFLIREAKRGNLKDSDVVLQTLQTIRDGDIDTTLHPHDIRKIVMDNKEYISRHPQNNLRDEFGWYSTLKIWEQIDQQLPDKSLKILEFDDHHDAHRLVYGIAVNEVRKRITVIFRGTYADGTDDWKRNLEFDQVELPLPFNLRRRSTSRGYHRHHHNTTPTPAESDVDDAMSEECSDEDGDVDVDVDDDDNAAMRVHQGMYNYLFNNCDRGTQYQNERYEEIVQQLQYCINRYPGFKVYVTGHSAGGALAKLFGFYLATSRLHHLNLAVPKPITVVGFGSLCVGDFGFQRAFQRAEGLGLIRHLRIINQGDPVCYLPPLINYMPSGMHLQLHRKSGFSFWRPNGPGNNTWSSLIQVLRFSIMQRSDVFDEHSVPSYLRRLEREKEALSLLTLDDLYRNSDVIPTEETLSLY